MITTITGAYVYRESPSADHARAIFNSGENPLATALREYELVVVLSPEVADDAVEETVERLVQTPITSRGGEVVEVNHWGRRRLAYPIDRHMEGNYVATQVRMDPT